MPLLIFRSFSLSAASKPPPVASTPSSPVSSSPPNKPSTSASVGAASGAKNRTSTSPQTSPKHALSTPVIASFPLEKKTRTASPGQSLCSLSSSTRMTVLIYTSLCSSPPSIAVVGDSFPPIYPFFTLCPPHPPASPRGADYSTRSSCINHVVRSASSDW